jgi:hypothetical protein
MKGKNVFALIGKGGDWDWRGKGNLSGSLRWLGGFFGVSVVRTLTLARFFTPFHLARAQAPGLPRPTTRHARRKGRVEKASGGRARVEAAQDGCGAHRRARLGDVRGHFVAPDPARVRPLVVQGILRRVQAQGVGVWRPFPCGGGHGDAPGHLRHPYKRWVEREGLLTCIRGSPPQLGDKVEAMLLARMMELNCKGTHPGRVQVMSKTRELAAVLPIVGFSCLGKD